MNYDMRQNLSLFFCNKTPVKTHATQVLESRVKAHFTVMLNESGSIFIIFSQKKYGKKKS